MNQENDRNHDMSGEPMNSYDYIDFHVEEGVAFIALNRPDVLNSFHTAMGVEFLEVLGLIETTDSIRSVHLTGSGRAFCAGQDLAEVLPSEDQPTRDLAEIVVTRYNTIVRAIRRIEKPFVCAVNGVAAGAGANLALACDITFAADDASFVQSFSRIGLVPDSGGTFILPRLVGLQRATAYMMLAEKLTGQEAAVAGLIYKSVPAESLQDESTKLAKRLATQPTKGLGLTKRALNASFSNSLDEQLDLEAHLQGVAGATADYAEGVAAFVEKRKPSFVGR